MQIDKDRERLRKLLIEDTNMPERLAREIAVRQIRQAQRLAGLGQAADPDESAVQKYILEHSEEISTKIEEVLDELCVKILPRERLSDLLSQFGVLALFLVPPIGCLVRQSVLYYSCQKFDDAASGFCACLFLIVLLFASAVAVFKKERDKN